MRFDGYIRVSDTKGRSGERFLSPEIQRDTIRRLAREKALELNEPIVEELDVSGGKRVEDRELGRLIERVEKNKNPFKPDEVVRATRTFAWEGGVVHKGEKYRGSDPAVVAGWNAFVPGETLDQELENPFDVLPPPPEFEPPVEVRGISIPIWRQVVCTVDTSVPVGWAPDSPGAKSDTPPPFLRSTLRRGQVLDVLSDVVTEPELVSLGRARCHG